MLLNNLVASNSSRSSVHWDTEHSSRGVVDKTEKNKLLNNATNEQSRNSSLDEVFILNDRNGDNATKLHPNQPSKGSDVSKLIINHCEEPVSIQLKNVATKRDFRYTPHFPTPLYHLKLRTQQMYTDALHLNQLDLFQVALELFNRKSVRTTKKESDQDCPADEICQYFFQSVGKARVTPKLCTECRDVQKNRFRYDYYYVDLVEISQERTVMCSDCMYQLLKKHIYGTDGELRMQLQCLREQQPNGVLVDPYLISCGF